MTGVPRQAARACHWPALSSDSKRFSFTLKCKPGRHIFCRAGALVCGTQEGIRLATDYQLILFTVMLLISGGLKQSDFGYCLVLFCAWERPVLRLYLMSAARNTHSQRLFSLCVFSI